MKLKQTTPRTEEEKTEHSVAAERRRMRLVYADTIQDLLANCAIQDGEWPQVGKAASVLHDPCALGTHWTEEEKNLLRMSTHVWPQAWLTLSSQGFLQGKGSLWATCPVPRSCEDGVRIYRKLFVIHKMHLGL